MPTDFWIDALAYSLRPAVMLVRGTTVHPDELRMDIRIRKIPAGLVASPGNPSVGVVAGTRYLTRQTRVTEMSVSLGGQVIAGRRAA